jgi:sentrin-specific protease 7
MMLHLDSMTQSGGHNSEVVSKMVRRYLNKEWKSQKSVETESKFDARYMPTYRVNVPRQNNGCDCGVFILAFLEKFLTEQPEILKKTDVQLAAQKRSFGTSDAGKFLRKNWFPNEFVDELRAKLSLLIIQHIQASLAEDDASKIVLNTANQEQMKDYERRQWRTKQAVLKAERDCKKRMETMEEERRRKLEPQDVADNAKTKASDAKDKDFEISREVKVKKTPTAMKQTQMFAGSNWSKARQKEPVREETCEEKPFEAFAGTSFKVGRSARPQAPSPSADWTSGTIRPRYGNANLLKRAERSRAKQNEEDERSAEAVSQARAKVNEKSRQLSEKLKMATARFTK